jgi:hypothetical protein
MGTKALLLALVLPILSHSWVTRAIRGRWIIITSTDLRFYKRMERVVVDIDDRSFEAHHTTGSFRGKYRVVEEDLELARCKGRISFLPNIYEKTVSAEIRNEENLHLVVGRHHYGLARVKTTEVSRDKAVVKEIVVIQAVNIILSVLLEVMRDEIRQFFHL